MKPGIGSYGTKLKLPGFKFNKYPKGGEQYSLFIKCCVLVPFHVWVEIQQFENLSQTNFATQT